MGCESAMDFISFWYSVYFSVQSLLSVDQSLAPLILPMMLFVEVGIGHAHVSVVISLVSLCPVEVCVEVILGVISLGFGLCGLCFKLLLQLVTFLGLLAMMMNGVFANLMRNFREGCGSHTEQLRKNSKFTRLKEPTKSRWHHKR